MNFREALLILPLAFATCAVAYHGLFCVLAFLLRRKTAAGEPGDVRFAIVVPAHDEGAHLSGTLESLKAQDYPRHLFDIFVVADNCNDDTAQVAEREGARVLVRNDPARRGKGYALAFAFSRLLNSGYEALVVVDADVRADAGFLMAFARRLHAGGRVLQARDAVENPDAAPLTYLLHVGNCMEDLLFHLPKARLGLPTILRGNGMCFAASVLRGHPWDAFSITEDTEYGLKLLKQGVYAEFVPEAEVRAISPVTFGQLRMQRLRWGAGNAGLAKRMAFGMILRGLFLGKLALADAGWSLLVASRPLLALATLLPLCAALVLPGVRPGFVWWGVWLLAAQTALVGAGVWVAGVSRTRLGHLLHLPGFALRMAWISILGLAGRRRDEWVRTERS